MFTIRPFNYILAVAVALVLSSCATVKSDEDASDYQSEIKKLQIKLVDNPRNATALRDLGVIYFQTKNYPQALDYLKRSYAIDGRDAKTMFYYGMSLESTNETNSALGVYVNYTDASSLSPYKKLIEGRYRSLTRDVIHQQFQTLIAQEEKLGNDRLGAKAVAVFPLAYQGTDEKYDALGKGLSELMINDLGQVKSLTLVERVRIEALLDELKFSQSKAVDQTTAPRLGKLVSAGRIVSGSFNVSGGNQLRLDVASWDVAKKKYPDPVSQSDALDNLFKLEKDLVFGVIKDMGIKLTTTEREKIQFIPTKNLMAFLAYSIGLKEEDRGDFKAASVYYKQAISLDPNFNAAKAKADAADALAVAGGSMENALAAVEQFDRPLRAEMPKPPSNLINIRLENLGNGIGSGFMPGEDDRDPAQEAARPGGPVGRLPDPPAPPNR